MPLPAYTPFVFLAAVVASAVGLFAWAVREGPGSRALVVFLLSASVWALADGLALATPGIESKLFWTSIAVVASALVALSWLVTVLVYTGNERLLTRSRLLAGAVEPLALAALVWTNPGHELLWSHPAGTRLLDGSLVLVLDPGLAFWGHVAYSYALVAVGAALVARSNFGTSRVFRTQGTALLVAVAVPSILAALALFDVFPPGYDPTGAGFLVTAVVIATALHRDHLLEVVPATREIGREAAVEEVDDRVVIVDTEGRIADVNPAARRLFDADAGELAGRPLSDVCPTLGETITDSGADGSELELDVDDRVRYYDVRVSPLYREYGSVAGHVLSLRDVTRRRQRRQRLTVLNRLLRHNLRNEMNVVHGNVSMLKQSLDDEQARERLCAVERTVRDVVERGRKVGRLSRVLDEDTVHTVDLGEQLTGIVADAHDDYPDAEITLDAPETLGVEAGPALELAVTELVENAIEHNDGETPRVTVTGRLTGDRFVTLTVSDDGPGIERQERSVIEEGHETDLRHGSGVGLWLVNWIVRTYGGTVTFEDGTDGATVSVRLPADDELTRTDVDIAEGAQ
jgi:PAS domain S-box-containing protein